MDVNLLDRGLTTVRLMAEVNQLRGGESFQTFYTDATFKRNVLDSLVLLFDSTDWLRMYHLLPYGS